MGEKDTLNYLINELSELNTQMCLIKTSLQAQIDELDSDRAELEERIEDELLDLELRISKLEKEIEELQRRLER